MSKEMFPGCNTPSTSRQEASEEEEEEEEVTIACQDDEEEAPKRKHSPSPPPLATKTDGHTAANVDLETADQAKVAPKAPPSPPPHPRSTQGGSSNVAVTAAATAMHPAFPMMCPPLPAQPYTPQPGGANPAGQWPTWAAAGPPFSVPGYPYPPPPPPGFVRPPAASASGKGGAEGAKSDGDSEAGQNGGEGGSGGSDKIGPYDSALRAAYAAKPALGTDYFEDGRVDSSPSSPQKNGGSRKKEQKARNRGMSDFDGFVDTAEMDADTAAEKLSTSSCDERHSQPPLGVTAEAWKVLRATRKRKLEEEKKEEERRKKAKASSANKKKQTYRTTITGEKVPIKWKKRTLEDGRKPPVRKLSDVLKKRYDELMVARSEDLRSKTELRDAELAVEEALRRRDDARTRAKSAAQSLIEADDAVFEAEKVEPCRWRTNYSKLVAYKEQHGHLRIEKESDLWKDLGRWIKFQKQDRTKYERGGDAAFPHKPVRCRLRALDELGLVWNEMKGQWMKRFNEMLQYKEEYGDCCIPKGYKPNLPLGAWVHRQRYFFRLWHEGKANQLNQEKIDLLNSVGFVWSGKGPDPDGITRVPKPTTPRGGGPRKTEEEEWSEVYTIAADVYARKGTLKGVASEQSREGHKIRDWCAWQRKQYALYKEGKPNHLTEEKIRLLNELEFSWDVSMMTTNKLKEKKEREKLTSHFVDDDEEDLAVKVNSKDDERGLTSENDGNEDEELVVMMS